MPTHVAAQQGEHVTPDCSEPRHVVQYCTYCGAESPNGWKDARGIQYCDYCWERWKWDAPKASMREGGPSTPRRERTERTAASITKATKATKVKALALAQVEKEKKTQHARAQPTARTSSERESDTVAVADCQHNCTVIAGDQ